MNRPQDKTIRNVVEYLESIGLTVYGRNTDVDTGEQFHACMDFSPEDVVKYRRLCEKDELFDTDLEY